MFQKNKEQIKRLRFVKECSLFFVPKFMNRKEKTMVSKYFMDGYLEELERGMQQQPRFMPRKNGFAVTEESETSICLIILIKKKIIECIEFNDVIESGRNTYTHHLIQVYTEMKVIVTVDKLKRILAEEKKEKTIFFSNKHKERCCGQAFL